MQQDSDILKLIANPEWQKQYKNFIYQHSNAFSDNSDDAIAKDLFIKFQQTMHPFNSKYLTQQQIEEVKQNHNYPQLASLYDFDYFKQEMIAQNQMLDIVALELIRKEQNNADSSGSDEDDADYIEQQRQQVKAQIAGKPYLEEKKKELEQSIKETLQQLNLPEIINMKQQEKVDQLGFQVGIQDKEDDELKKTVKLRTLKLKQEIPQQKIKITAIELKKRRIQAEAIKLALQQK